MRCSSLRGRETRAVRQPFSTLVAQTRLTCFSNATVHCSGGLGQGYASFTSCARNSAEPSAGHVEG
jgi:hypothetical protein